MRLKKIEIALCFGLLASLLVGATKPNTGLEHKLIRLHILANSDSQRDQDLKLELRDSVLEMVAELTSTCVTMDEALDILGSNIEQLQNYAQSELQRLGSSYKVSVVLDREYFNTRHYDSFSLPAGIYDTLKITIGEGQGHNWWCVVFPAICMAATTEELTVEAMRAGLSSDDVALITEDGSFYVLKFKIIEILANLKQQFSNCCFRFFAGYCIIYSAIMKRGKHMLHILTGREGSGKTKAMLSEILDQTNSIIIVPEQYSYDFELLLCQVGGDTASQKAEVLNFTRLANRVFSQAGGLAVEYLDTCGRVLAMTVALKLAAPRLKLFSTAASSADHIENMVAAIDELQNYKVTPEALESAAELATGTLADKLRELALIMEAYNSITTSGAKDPVERTRMLAEKLEECDYAQNKNFYIDCFSDFTKLELDVIEVLVAKAKSVTIAMTWDEEDLYDLQSQTIRQLEAIARRRSVKCVTTHMEEGTRLHQELYWLDHGLSNYSLDAYQGLCQAIELAAAPNLYSECSWAAKKCLELVFEQGFRWRDISIVVADMATYGQKLKQSFESYDVPLYLNVKSDIMAKPAISVLTSAMDAINYGYEYDDVCAFLKSGFANITQEECDLLENYVLSWNIRGNGWKEAWAVNPLGFGKEENEKTKSQLEKLNQLREKAISPLVHLEDSLKGSLDGQQKILAVYDFLVEIQLADKLQELCLQYQQKGDSQLEDECSQLWEILLDVLQQCHSTLEGIAVTNTELAKLLRIAFSSGDVGTIPVYYDAVSVGEISRMRHRTAKVLIVIGANDGSMPSAISGAGIISEDERIALRELGIELAATSDEKLIQQIGIIHSCLCCAREKLYMSWRAKGDSGEELRSSMIVQRIRSLFPDLTVTSVAENADYWSAQEAYLASFTDPGLTDWLTSDPELLKKQQSVFLRLDQSEDLSADASRQLYGSRVRLSATKIDVFNSCKFKYFMQYGLKAEARKKNEFSAPEYGTFIHFILENICTAAQNAGGFRKYDKSQLPPLIDKLIMEYTSTQLAGGLETKPSRFQYLFKRLSKNVRAIADNVFDELACSDFVPLDFELEFSDSGDLAAVDIPGKDSSGAVVGKVDRVDGYVKDGKLYLRVVDYKTGCKSFDFTDIKQGMGLQMLIYLFALKTSGEKRYNMPVEPAGVLYLPARNDVISASRYITDDELEKLRNNNLTRSGLLLDDEEILDAMEHRDGAPRFMPFKLNKEGNPIGPSLASAEQLGKLSQYVDKELKNLISALSGGKSAPDPYQRGENTPCQWCDYAEACRNEKFRKIKSCPAETFWSELDKEEVTHRG